MLGTSFRDPFKDLFVALDEVLDNRNYNVNENHDSIVLTADLPGVKQSDIRVVVEGNILSIQAQRGSTRSWAYSWIMPASVNTENITCGYEDGVLTVDLPKLESAKMRQIEVAAKVGAPTKIKTEKQLAAPAAV